MQNTHLLNSMGCIELERCRFFTLTLMWPWTWCVTLTLLLNYCYTQNIKYVEISKIIHKIGGGRYVYIDLHVTLILMCDLDLINSRWQQTHSVHYSAHHHWHNPKLNNGLKLEISVWISLSRERSFASTNKMFRWNFTSNLCYCRCVRVFIHFVPTDYWEWHQSLHEVEGVANFNNNVKHNTSQNKLFSRKTVWTTGIWTNG